MKQKNLQDFSDRLSEEQEVPSVFRHDKTNAMSQHVLTQGHRS